MRKLIIVLLIAISAAAPAAAGASAQNADRVYIIETAGHLKWFRKAVNDGVTGIHAILSCDIDLGGQSWRPIGDSEETAFKGSFDGRGHSIRGLSIRGEGQFLGLFGYLDNSGIVSNLRVENASIVFEGRGGASVGAVAGYSKGIIDACEVVKSSVRAAGNASRPDPVHAGAVAGFNDDGVIINCVSEQNSVHIADKKNNRREVAAGGICGMNAGMMQGVGLIMNCESHSNEIIIATGRYEIGCYGGGIAGLTVGGSIRECTVYGGKITSPVSTGSFLALGGVLGSSVGGCYIEKCAVDGDILIHSGEGSDLGGLGGLAGSLIRSNVSKCAVKGVILSATGSATHYVGGIAGSFGGGKISDCRVSGIVMPKNQDHVNFQGAVAGILFMSGNGGMMVENTWFHKAVAGGQAIGANRSMAEIDAKPFDAASAPSPRK